MAILKTIVTCCGLMILLSFAAIKAHGQMPPLSDRDKGSSLFQQCKADIRVTDSAAESDADRYSALQCVGYLQGFTDAYALVTEPRFCLGDASFGTLARVYVKYMEDNPKYMDMHRGIGFMEALKNAYPCQK